MAARKSGLGRGLDAIIPVDRPDRGYAEVPIDRIRPNPQQPRKAFSEDSLQELAASMRQVGVLQPIVVRPDEEADRYVLVAGERRLRAAEIAGLAEIPTLIREAGEAGANLVEALVENLQREDLTPLEEAAAYRELLEESDMSHEALAVRVGKTRSTVSNMLRLLQLPAPIQGMLERGELSAGAARALLGLDDAAYAVHIGERAVAEGWSVRQIEDAVRARSGSDVPQPKKSLQDEARPAAIIELEQRLADHLGSKVKIDYGKRGGKLVVRFADLEDLERIYRQFYR